MHIRIYGGRGFSLLLLLNLLDGRPLALSPLLSIQTQYLRQSFMAHNSK